MVDSVLGLRTTRDAPVENPFSAALRAGTAAETGSGLNFGFNAPAPPAGSGNGGGDSDVLSALLAGGGGLVGLSALSGLLKGVGSGPGIPDEYSASGGAGGGGLLGSLKSLAAKGLGGIPVSASLFPGLAAGNGQALTVSELMALEQSSPGLLETAITSGGFDEGVLTGLTSMAAESAIGPALPLTAAEIAGAPNLLASAAAFGGPGAGGAGTAAAGAGGGLLLPLLAMGGVAALPLILGLGGNNRGFEEAAEANTAQGAALLGVPNAQGARVDVPGSQTAMDEAINETIGDARQALFRFLQDPSGGQGVTADTLRTLNDPFVNQVLAQVGDSPVPMSPQQAALLINPLPTDEAGLREVAAVFENNNIPLTPELQAALDRLEVA